MKSPTNNQVKGLSLLLILVALIILCLLCIKSCNGSINSHNRVTPTSETDIDTTQSAPNHSIIMQPDTTTTINKKSKKSKKNTKSTKRKETTYPERSPLDEHIY